MRKSSKLTAMIAMNAVIAALYCALTISLGNIAFGPIQFRPAEALTILPFMAPHTMFGLFIGCLLSNVFSQFGLLDIIFGSLATLLAGFLTSKCKNVWLAAVPPIIINAIVVGALIMVGTPGAGFIAWPVNAGWIGLTQTIFCAGLGIPLYFVMKKRSLDEPLSLR